MEREKLKQTEGAVGYRITKNIKHKEMEDSLMNFASAMSAINAAFM